MWAWPGAGTFCWLYPKAPLLHAVPDIPTQLNVDPESEKEECKRTEQMGGGSPKVLRIDEHEIGAHRGTGLLNISVTVFFKVLIVNTHRMGIQWLCSTTRRQTGSVSYSVWPKYFYQWISRWTYLICFLICLFNISC